MKKQDFKIKIKNGIQRVEYCGEDIPKITTTNVYQDVERAVGCSCQLSVTLLCSKHDDIPSFDDRSNILTLPSGTSIEILKKLEYQKETKNTIGRLTFLIDYCKL